MTTQPDATQAAIESIGRDYITLADISIELAKLKAELNTLRAERDAWKAKALADEDARLVASENSNTIRAERDAARADAERLANELKAEQARIRELESAWATKEW